MTSNQQSGYQQWVAALDAPLTWEEPRQEADTHGISAFKAQRERLAERWARPQSREEFPVSSLDQEHDHGKADFV